MAILPVRFLWRARTRGDFPIQSSTWQVEVTSGSTGSSRAPQYCTRIRSMRSFSVCPSSNLWRRTYSCGTLDVVSKFFIVSRVPINKSIWPLDEVMMMKYDETYDEIGVITASKCLARMTGCCMGPRIRT